MLRQKKSLTLLAVEMKILMISFIRRLVEKEANHIPEDEHLESRMMYLDLLGYIR